MHCVIIWKLHGTCATLLLVIKISIYKEQHVEFYFFSE